MKPRDHFLRLLLLGHFLSWWPVIHRDTSSVLGASQGLSLALWSPPWLPNPVGAALVVGGLGLMALWGTLQPFQKGVVPILGAQMLGQAYFFSIHLPSMSSFSPALWALTLCWLAGLPERAAVAGIFAGWSLHSVSWLGPGWGSLGLVAPVLLLERAPTRILTLVLALWALLFGVAIDFDLGLLMAGAMLAILPEAEPEDRRPGRSQVLALSSGLVVAWVLPFAPVDRFQAVYQLGDHRIVVDEHGFCRHGDARLLQPLQVSPGCVFNPGRFRQPRFWLTSPLFHRLTGARLAESGQWVEVTWKGNSRERNWRY